MIIIETIVVLVIWYALAFFLEFIFGADGGILVFFSVIFIVGLLGVFFLGRWP